MLRLYVKSLLVALGLWLVFWLAAWGLVLWAMGRVPDERTIQTYTPPQSTKVYDRYGNLVYEFYQERRTFVPLDSIPRHVQNAFIAMEDRRFWSHWGVDIRRTLVALVVNLTSGRIRQGGSTITQQLARNAFLTQRQTLRRKLLELALAIKTERTLSKEEILERYLNQIYFGSGVYGVEAAARHYFGKHVWELDVAEAALLAGLPKNPNEYSPFVNPDKAIARQRVVLSAMLSAGVIDRDTYERALKEKLRFANAQAEDLGSLAPYYMEEVRKYIAERYGVDFLYKGGGRIYTALDPDLQRAANRAVDSVLAVYERRWPKALKYLYKNYDPKSKKPPKYLQAALVAMDPHTGEVLALVGGRNWRHSQFNRATQAKRQTGSAFKPFVYLAAIEKLGLGSGDIVMDEPKEVRDGPRVWNPSNFDHKYLGPIPAIKALALSRNLAAVRVAQEVGMGAVVEMARRLGIKTSLEPYYSTALGAQSLTPLEMVTAFSTIADYGTRHEPLFVLKVTDGEGNVLEENRPMSQKVVDSASVYVLISMMKAVMDQGTGAPARAMGFTRPAAGKTGTTNNYKDAWFIGFTPDLVCGVWVGFDNPRPMPGGTGTRMALPVWTAFMRKATAGKPARDFPVPKGVSSALVCSQTGLLATPACPEVVSGVWRSGFEPTEPCTLHLRSPGERVFERMEIR